MNPYPYAPTGIQPVYQQPPPGSYVQPSKVPMTSFPPQVDPYALFGGMQFIYVQDPLSELASCPSLLIRQEPEFLENLSGCEFPNIYHVFGNSPLGYRYLFKCIEKSNCCTRRFCPSTQRPFDMDIIHCNSMDQLGIGYTTPFATMRKPFMCTMCCFCRPEINVILNSTSKAIGKVRHICTVCDPTFELYSVNGILKYIITAECCQCALLCPGFLSKTSRGLFEILDSSTKQRVGQITKEPATMSEMVTDADTYVVNFPANADAYDKLLITGLALMIDYQYFETDADEEHKGKRRGRSRFKKSKVWI